MREILESIDFAEVTPLGKGSKRFRKLLGALMAVREIEAGRKKGIPLKKALDGL